MKIDLLAFGVHPDDVELGCGGVLLAEKKAGKRTGIIDLTRGELGTRGTAETRKAEAADAAKILQLDVRENLGLADGFFENNEASQKEVIRVLRRYRPEIIICNAPEDRHPDHGRASALVSDAAFLSGLAKVKTSQDGEDQEPWRPSYVLHYVQDRWLTPDFVVDISDFFEGKIEAVRAYKTQFHNETSTEPQTYISSPEFLEGIIARGAQYGKMIGVKYAEGFLSKKTIGLKRINDLVQNKT